MDANILIFTFFFFFWSISKVTQKKRVQDRGGKGLFFSPSFSSFFPSRSDNKKIKILGGRKEGRKEKEKKNYVFLLFLEVNCVY